MRKKYLFPFEKEKKHIPYKEIFSFFTGIYILIIILCLATLRISSEETELSKNTFYRNSPDLIVVPTGDFGRIPKALEFAKKFSISNIFITGVYEKNSLNTIIPNEEIDSINLNLMEIDYWARNTIENAISTLKYLNNKKEIKTILVVSSDYHILRTRMIFNFLKGPKSDFQFYYHGVENDYSTLENLIKIHKEAFKIVRGYIIMLLWTPEVS